MASGRKTSIRCSCLSASASPEKLLETKRSLPGGHAAIKSQRAFRLRPMNRKELKRLRQRSETGRTFGRLLLVMLGALGVF
jgi:hypothetical protein